MLFVRAISISSSETLEPIRSWVSSTGEYILTIQQFILFLTSFFKMAIYGGTNGGYTVIVGSSLQTLRQKHKQVLHILCECYWVSFVAAKFCDNLIRFVNNTHSRLSNVVHLHIYRFCSNLQIFWLSFEIYMAGSKPPHFAIPPWKEGLQWKFCKESADAFPFLVHSQCQPYHLQIWSSLIVRIVECPCRDILYRCVHIKQSNVSPKEGWV